MIRYPGSKAKIAKQILRHFPHHVQDPLWQSARIEYREPFFGGGAIGMALFDRLPNRASLWLNDKDLGMISLWKSIHEDPDALLSEIQKFTPSVEAFYRFKEEDGRVDMDPVRAGFQKFVLHQTGWSGLGVMAGGPLGGAKQGSDYGVGCRWNATRHCLAIREIHKTLRRFAGVRITCRDFSSLIDGAPVHSFIYADPPYYEKGPELYKYSMSEDDHARLARSLNACRAPWVLSYDDHPAIRALYPRSDIASVALTYTIGAAGGDRRRKNSEIVITPRAAAQLREVS